MTSPVVSVILPVYNAEATIALAIESILHQTLSDFELIIINNGSTDQTSKIISGFRDPRINVITLPNPNLVAALNIGIKHAKAAYIARMDADDFSYPERLIIQKNYLQENAHIGLVSGKVNYTGDAKKNEGYYLYVDWVNAILSPEAIYLTRFQESALPHPSVMFRKSVGEKYGFYREGDFPEDFELWNRWMYHGVSMSKVNQVVLDWHDSPGRLSRTHAMYQSDKFSAIKAKYFVEWFDRKFPHRNHELYVWGAGSSVKQKSKHLEKLGLPISKFIDVKKSSSPTTIHYLDLKFATDIFVLSYVSDRKGKTEIHSYLKKLGFTEGTNFYMME